MSQLPTAALIILACTSATLPADDTPTPTKEFSIRDGVPYLDAAPVKLWGLRCNNALLSPAVTERLVNNMDNMTAHGINLISVCLQGTNGGFPDVNAGPNGFTSNGQLIPAFGRRLELVIREADQRGMVVCVGLFMPRKDELLRDETAVQHAIEASAHLLVDRQLKNVFVNLYQEFNHPLRVDHDIFREPDGAAKKAKLTGWFKAIAPDIEVGICPNYLTGSAVEYPGCDVMFFHEGMPIPATGFAVNTETADRDASGNEGVFNKYDLVSMHAEWEAYRNLPRVAMLFRSPYLEDVRGKQGTGPNFEMGGGGTGESDRGVKPYFLWLRDHVGRWEYPVHVRDGQVRKQDAR